MSPDPPDRIDNLANGYQASQILLTANRLRLFPALSEGAKTSTELCEELATDARATRILCEALVDLGLLQRTDKGYAAGADVRRHLLPDSPEPRTDLLAHAAKQYERWGGLYDAVRSGAPVPQERLDPRLEQGPEPFARAMADVARRSATATCRLLDLDGTESLLDLGGGPGIYALEFLRRWPRLQVTILDDSESLEVARHNLESARLGDRVRLLAGDAFVDPLRGPYEAIFVSNVLHIYPSDANRRLIARCAGALGPGGRLILKDFFIDDDRVEPKGAAVFAVNMLVSTEGGDCYTLSEAESWLDAAGLELSEVRDVASKSRLIVALRRS